MRRFSPLNREETGLMSHPQGVEDDVVDEVCALPAEGDWVRVLVSAHYLQPSLSQTAHKSTNPTKYRRAAIGPRREATLLTPLVMIAVRGIWLPTGPAPAAGSASHSDPVQRSHLPHLPPTALSSPPWLRAQFPSSEMLLFIRFEPLVGPSCGFEPGLPVLSLHLPIRAHRLIVFPSVKAAAATGEWGTASQPPPPPPLWSSPRVGGPAEELLQGFLSPLHLRTRHIRFLPHVEVLINS
ncbi:unnamed protein product [Boreogadus saida]